jgi:hypothetical protein
MVLVTTLVTHHPYCGWCFVERSLALSELIVLVLNDPSKTEDVLTAWLARVISGVTLLDSSGLSHQMSQVRNMLGFHR